ncbi:hypothetical protein B0H16DRAFT_756651 [Mycena metata]|uniref:Uncharacterized protein n=1 Tax=Mycena metata TaxID=1033252 RepID=A0AAD7J204_9AGAR|nr:hypothetical protein B0H16DRAFT_756651 [Mycena metata]
MSYQRPVFIHYTIYDLDKKKTIPSLYPAPYANDPCIGRVDVSQIRAPHTVKALVEHICKREKRRMGLDFDHDDAFGTVLFKGVTTAKSYELEDSIGLLENDRPGLTPENPVILSVWYADIREVLPGPFGWPEWACTAPSVEMQNRNPLYRSQPSAVFVHYQIYDLNAKQTVKSRHTGDFSSDPTIGRIDVAEIPGPHTAAVLIQRICEQENRKVGWDGGDDAYGTTLFKNTATATPYDPEDPVNLLANDYLGSTPQDPVILSVWYRDMHLALFHDLDEGPTLAVQNRNPLYRDSQPNQVSQAA